MATASQPSPPAEPRPERRNFLVSAGALFFGGLVALVPVVSGLVVFLDPLRRKRPAGAFLRVTNLASLPEDGVPRQFPVVAERLDAWNRSLEPIGAVYLSRGEGEQTPRCWTATCPHAGCFVDFDGLTNTFKCPCHNSAFTVDGQIVSPSPSPRAMDSLECKIERGEVLVKFENFYTGKTDKVIKE